MESILYRVKYLIYILFAFIVVSIPTANIMAEVIDDDPEAVSLYAKGKRLLKEENYYNASQIFLELAGRFSTSKNIDLFVFNRAKAELYLSEYNKAIASFSYYIRKFNNKIEYPYAYYFRGNAHYLKGNISQAIKDYIAAYGLSNNDKLSNQAKASLEASFKSARSINMGISDFQSIPQNKCCDLIKILADIQLERGEISKAKKLLDYCNLTFDPSQVSGETMERYKDSYEIAVVLPFTGELNNFAQNIFNGIVIAAEMFRENSGKNIKLSTYDTKGDPIEAGRIIGELSKSFETDACIGPLTSNEASVSSAALSCSSLPLIIPAATQAGLTRLSETSFQLSPNIELEGIRMAEYAIKNIQADSAVIITSTATEHLRMARAFSDRFKQLGGNIVVIEYYRPRDNDFGKIIRDIKTLLIGFDSEDDYYINPDGDTLIPEEIVASVDCLFLPGSPKQLRQLAQQLHFYSLTGSYLGSDGWSDESVMKLGDNITKGIVFSSPFLSTGSGDEYFSFAAQYDSHYGGKPNRLTNLGYDAMKLIAMAILDGNQSKESVAEFIKNITDYHGVSGFISFGEHRENMIMPLYKVELEQAIPLIKPNAVPTDNSNLEEQN